jgi:D-ribose pyranase
MKRSTILNRDLSAALAALGHGDKLIVCDAGFPVPVDSRRIDLAVCQDLPPLEPVLAAIFAEANFEKVTVSEEMRDFNPPLHAAVKSIFGETPLEYIPHDTLMYDWVREAKFIVRTGAFNPWGNIVLHSLPDIPKWFQKPGSIVPPWYKDAAK